MNITKYQKYFYSVHVPMFFSLVGLGGIIFSAMNKNMDFNFTIFTLGCLAVAITFGFKQRKLDRRYDDIFIKGKEIEL